MNLDITQVSATAAVVVVLAVIAISIYNGGVNANQLSQRGSSFSARVRGTVYTP